MKYDDLRLLTLGRDCSGKTTLIGNIANSSSVPYAVRKLVLSESPNPGYEKAFKLIKSGEAAEDEITKELINGMVFEIQKYKEYQGYRKPALQDSAHIEKTLYRSLFNGEHENVAKMIEILDTYPDPQHVVCLETNIDERIRRMQEREELTWNDRFVLKNLKENKPQIIETEKKLDRILENRFDSMIKIDTGIRTSTETLECVRRETGL